jgi:hypothetical protein
LVNLLKKFLFFFIFYGLIKMSNNSNITSGFIDLATFDELEKYAYGGPDATAYFVREVRKATWFTIVPVVLSKANGNPGFGQEWAAQVSRAGDYLLATWLRVTFPRVELTADLVGYKLRWTRNLMHNLIQSCTVTFNDLMAAQFDNHHLDFWAAFTTPAGKYNGYQNMILNTDDVAGGAFNFVEAHTGNLPLPFFFSRDSGVALPTAALPYNDIRIQFQFRDWDALLIKDNPFAAPGTPSSTAVLSSQLTGGVPVMTNAQVWANYAIVSNDERKRMACAPRNIFIEQAQVAPTQTFAPITNPTPSYDIRFSHAIKVFFFACRNTTVAPAWSNYTTASAVVSAANTVVNNNPAGAGDPISQFTLVYENTQRLAAMGSDYFSLVNPWYHAPVIPQETGYHMYSYSLDFICLDPKGSTNYGKLTNVSVSPVASSTAVTAAGGDATSSGKAHGIDVPQTFKYIHTAVNNNIIRVSGGALGFPVL